MGGGTRRYNVMVAAFNKTILCAAATEDPSYATTALACQPGFYYERQTGEEHPREQEQLRWIFFPPANLFVL